MTKKLLTLITIILLFSQNLFAEEKGFNYETCSYSAADTFHTARTTWDYGWNGLSRQYIVTDALGRQHIVFPRRTTLSSAATRRIYYQFEIDDNALQVGVDVTPLGQGSSSPWIDYTSDNRAVITSGGGLVERLHVDQASGFGLFSSNPHPLDPETITPQPSLVVDRNLDRIYWWSTKSTRLYFTDDEGVSWDSTSYVWDDTSTSTYSAIAMSADFSKMAVWDRFGSEIKYSITEDGGVTFTEVTPIINGTIVDTLTDSIWAGPFCPPNLAYCDTLLIHPSRGIDLGFDSQNNVHMVMNGLAYHRTDDSTYVNTTGIFHYSSARGEGAVNLIELSDQYISHAAFIDSAINLEPKRYTGNGAGFNMPTIAAASDAYVLIALWVQWNGAVGGNMESLLADTGSTGFFTSAIWAVTSGDGGNTWSDPWKLSTIPGASLEFVTLDPVIETIFAGVYRYHALWLEDLSPGISLFGEGDSSMNYWVYGTEELPGCPPPPPPPPVGIDNSITDDLEFSLTQNHPNPFNPMTIIDYSLPAAGDVTLIIYNLRGEEVARLVDGFQQAGEYNTIWNAYNVSSGIYFYRLRSGDYTETKEMVLLK